MLLHMKLLCCIRSFHVHTEVSEGGKEIFYSKLYLTLWEEMNPKSEIYDTPKLVAVYIALENLFETWMPHAYMRAESHIFFLLK